VFDENCFIILVMEVEVKLHSFLTFTLNAGDWSPLYLATLHPGKEFH